MKHIIAATGLAALALAGCGQAGSNGAPGAGNSAGKGTGDVQFNLDLPNGDVLNSVQLTLMCPGFTQTHTVNLANGEEVAAFAGILPGNCTVSVTGTTVDGDSCSGMSSFAIMANVVAESTVAVVCNAGGGTDMTATGGVKVDTTVTIEGGVCPAPRVKKIYAIPSNLPQGGSTTVEVETMGTTGATTVSFDATSNPLNVGSVTLAGEGTGCAATSADCVDVTCTAGGVVYVDVTVVDDQCTDTESIWIDCGGPAAVCGNGVREGSEACDGTDGIDPATQSCSATCTIVTLNLCGNGVLNGSEQCDGTAGLMTGQICGADCTITPVCGNSIQEGTEACDAGPTGSATCTATCTLIAPAVCGNNVREGSEVCDGTDVAAGFTCAADCLSQTPVVAGNVCRDCIEDPAGVIAGALGPTLTACQGSADCGRALDCYTETFCANGATVSECYCGLGANPDNCLNGSVAPTGFCRDLIVELAGPGLTAADYINFSINDSNPVGLAYSLFAVTEDPETGCTEQCNDAPVPGPHGPF